MSLAVKLTLLSLIISPSAYGKNYMTFMGGGGEPKGDTTIFDSQIGFVSNFHKKSDWKTEISFNGGHKKTEDLIAKGFQGEAVKNAPFTEESFNRILKNYEDQLVSGSIKKGDQLMLVISTHGAQKRNGMATHEISLSGGAIQNYDTAEGSKRVSLDRLQRLTDLASSKGVKLALIDLSCHSGNTLALKNSHTCVISATGPNHYGYAGNSSTFTNQILKSFKKGISLEEAFLDARLNYTDTSFPMISSPVGTEINAKLYDPLTPYLYRYDDKHDKFSPYIRKEAEKGEACEAPRELEGLLSVITQVESLKTISKRARFSSQDAKEFRENLKKYYDLMARLRKELVSSELAKKEKEKESICTNYPDGVLRLCWTHTVAEILSMRTDVLRKTFSKPQSSKINQERAKVSLANLEKLEKRREEILRQHPELAKRHVLFKEWPKLEEQTSKLAREVTESSKKLYHSLYLNKSEQDTRANPCRDFRL